jgi:hypothetical protein
VEKWKSSPHPLDRVSNGYVTALNDLGVRATTPAFTHGRSQPRERFFHALAWARLTEDVQASTADAQRFASRIEQIERVDHEIRPSRARLQVRPKAIHQLAPPFEIDQRYLTTATLICVSGDAAAGDERRADGSVHGPAVRTLDPNLMQHSHCSSA